MEDPSGRGKAATIAVAIWLVSDFAFTLSAVLTLAAFGRLGAIWAQPDYALVDHAIAITGIVTTIAMIVSVVFVARWIMRVNANAQHWSNAMTVSPGWNVGYFFVPILNLWKPFQGLRETWQATHDPADPEGVPVPGFMRLWWALWLATNFLGNISFRLSMRSDTADSLVASSWFDVASFAVDVPLAFLLVMLIRRLDAAQNDAIHVSRFAETFE